MPGTQCCVPLCSNKGGHLFPLSDPGRTCVWLAAIRRAQFTPTKNSVVCKAHFTDTDYLTNTSSGK